MDKSQYKCIRAAINEVASLERDGYKLESFSNSIAWWMRFLKHPNGNTALVEMSPNRDCLRVWINSKERKCQNFGVSI